MSSASGGHTDTTSFRAHYYNGDAFVKEHQYACSASNHDAYTRYPVLMSKDGGMRVQCVGMKSGKNAYRRDVQTPSRMTVRVVLSRDAYAEDHAVRRFVSVFFGPAPRSVAAALDGEPHPANSRIAMEFEDASMLVDFFALAAPRHGCIVSLLRPAFDDWARLDVRRRVSAARRIQRAVLRRLYDVDASPRFVQRQRWELQAS
jgi:hypothetical protein